MKRRLLLFLAIFGTGLAVLLWLESRRTPEAEPAPPPAAPAQDAPDPFVEVPVQVGEGEEDFGAEGILEGRWSASEFFDTGTTRVLQKRVVAEDTRPLGDNVYEFVGVQVEQFDPETRQLELSLTAESARARLDLTLDDRIPIDPETPATLRGVTGQILRDVVFAPVSIRTEELTGALSSNVLETASDVVVTGRGLRAMGSGLRVDTDSRVLTFARAASLEVRRSGGRTATLSSAGPLEARRRAEGLAFGVVARDRARIEIRGPAGTGDRDATLHGDRIEILGASAEEGDEPFRLERVVATGGAVLRTADGEFLGDEATIEFDAEGNAVSALLSGAPPPTPGAGPDPRGGVGPVVRLDLRRGGDAADEETVRVELAGAGPLTLQLAEAQRGAFDLQGPAELRVPSYGGVLRAARRMRGVRTQAGRLGKLIAVGNVVGEIDSETLAAGRMRRGTLTTDELEVAAVAATEGEVAVLLTSRGPTRIEGELADGRAYELLATRGLSYRRTDESFQVPEARGVTFRVAGEGAFEATAGRIVDLNGTTLAFLAEQGVTFEGTSGRGEGETLQARSSDSGRLLGVPGRPARLEYDQGWLQAASIDYSPERLRAEGDAGALWEAEEATTTLDAPWVELVQSENERVLTAGDGVTTVVASGARSAALESRSLEVRGRLAADPVTGEDVLVGARVTARDEVIVDYQGESDLAAFGGLLEVELSGESEGEGRLLPAAGQRVVARGRLPAQELTFDLAADEVDFDDESLRARNAVVDVDGVAIGLGESSAPGSIRAIAGLLDADAESVLFEESVYVGRFDDSGEVWSLDADSVLLTAEPDAGDEGRTPSLSRLEAWGGFSLWFQRGMQAAGARLEADAGETRVRMTGSPVQVHVPGAYWTAKSFEVDPEVGSIRATRGSLRLEVEGDVSPWTLTYESIEPRVQRDETIQIVSRPVFIDDQRVVRADWAMLWIDPQGFRELTTGVARDPDLPAVQPQGTEPQEDLPPPPSMPSLFGDFELGEQIPWLRELYLDGDLEVLDGGLRVARAEAVYLDMVDGHGWLYDADFTLRSGQEVVSLHADWLRHSADGSLAANRAVLTSCEFAEPHFTVRSDTLAIEPRVNPDDEEETLYFVQLSDNAIHFEGGLKLPLPQITFGMDEDQQVEADQVSVAGAQPLSVGSSARYGTFVSTSVARDISGFAKRFNRFLKKLLPKGSLGLPAPPGLDGVSLGPEPTGKLDASAAYLGSRGGLVDLGIDVRAKDAYHFGLDSAVIYDTGRDRGLIRVPEDDREDFRWWVRERGRVLLGEDQWIDAVLSKQSDPGVQSEFFESDYIRYEEAETWLNWRRVDGQDYANVTAEARLDDWRTEVIEEPNARFYMGRREVTTWEETPVYYGSDSTFGRLRRVEGDPFYEGPFVDALGEGTSWRADTRHRVEAPKPLGRWGLIATPYVEGVGSAWSESATDDDTPARGGVLAGLELASTIWKPFGGDGLHELTGSVGLRTDVVSEETDATPFRFDAIENSIEGRFVDMKVRSLLRAPGGRHRWDLEAVLTHAEGTPELPDGFQPLQINTDWSSRIGDVLVGIYHDGRYDLENGVSPYARTLFGIEPTPEVNFALGHNVGRNTRGERIYDALTLSARWRVSRKYEVEGRQTFSLVGDGTLLTQGTVRRYGHDFVFEFDIGFREGEGSSFSVGVEPLLLFRQPRLAFVERLRSVQGDG